MVSTDTEMDAPQMCRYYGLCFQVQFVIRGAIAIHRTGRLPGKKQAENSTPIFCSLGHILIG
jgi:hypothetical protein